MTETNIVSEFAHLVGTVAGASDFEQFAASAEQTGRRLVVGALIVDTTNRIFVQRRMLNRVLFPGSWDVVGGHDDGSEGVIAALRREIFEETGWELDEVREVVAVLDWEVETGARREIDVIVTVTGDLENPMLEVEKHDKFHWVQEHEIDVLRVPGSDGFVMHLVREAFAILNR